MKKEKCKNEVGLLVSWSLSFYIILLGLNSFINKIWKNTVVDSYFLSFIYLVIAVNAVRVILKKINIKVLIIYIITAGVVYFSSELYNYENNFALTIGIFVFVGYALDKFESMEDSMIKCTMIAVIAAGLHITCTLINSGYIHDMVAAYSFLPMAVFTSYLCIYKNNFFYKIIAIISGIIVFVFATRGPLLIYLICTALIVLQSYSSRWTLKKTLSFGIVVVCLAVIIYNFETIMINANKLFESMGMSNSILNRFFSDSISDSNGRDLIKEDAYDLISKKLFTGYGCFADREMLGKYCHNIYIEFMFNYGTLTGAALISIYLYKSAKLLFINRYNNFIFAFLVSVYSVAIGKLFFSGSYLEQPEFFLVLGLLLNSKNFNKNTKKESVISNEENTNN